MVDQRHVERPDRGDRPERIETAEFAPTRVGGGRRRGWSPLLILGWLVVLGAAVGVGVLGQGSGVGGPGTIARGAGGHPTSVPTTGALAPTLAPTTAPEGSDVPSPISYSVSQDRTGITIAGTVLARPVVWVFVSVQKSSGDVLGWRSLSVEDPNGGIRPDQTPGFRVHVAIPASLAGDAIVIEVNAYDNLGRRLGSVRTVIPSFGREPLRLDAALVR